MIVRSINDFTMVLALKYLKIRPSGTWLEPQEEYGTVSIFCQPQNLIVHHQFSYWNTIYWGTLGKLMINQLHQLHPSFDGYKNHVHLFFFCLTSCSLSEHTRRCIKIRPRNQPSYWSFTTGQPLRNPHIWLWLKINTPIVYCISHGLETHCHCLRLLWQ